MNAYHGRLTYVSIIAVVLGAVVICAMVYGFTIEFKLPFPQIEVSIKRAISGWITVPDWIGSM